MGRPLKHQEPLIRLQPYVKPETAEWLKAEADKTHMSIGDIIDGWVQWHRDVAPGFTPPAPKAHQYVSKPYGHVCSACGHVRQPGDTTVCG
jgi:hypothetical protein